MLAWKSCTQARAAARESALGTAGLRAGRNEAPCNMSNRIETRSGALNISGLTKPVLFLLLFFFLPFSASQRAGGDLVPGLSPWLEEGEVCAGWGEEEEEGQGSRKRDTGPGHLPRQITSILQKRNPKTEVIVWKKSVSQTL